MGRSLLLLREIPLFVGIAAGIATLLKGGAFVRDGVPSGIQWFDYLALAFHLAHRLPGGMEDWRRPLYFQALGWVGERWGYVDGSILLASVSIVIVVIAAGIGARALAGPWVGGLAALTVPLVGSTVAAARWGTFYPSLAAATGLALALGACVARWPGVLLALAAGGAAGLAWALDVRGVMALPLGALLVVVGMSRPEAGRIRRWFLPLVFFAGLAWAPSTFRRTDVRVRPFAEQVGIQREVGIQWIRETRDAALIGVCGAVPDGVAAISGPCARALVRYNGTHRLPTEVPFPLGPLLVLLPLVVLPGGRGWRGSVSALFAVGGPATVLGLQCAVLPVPERYVLQVAVPLAMAVPVALDRVAHTVLPLRLGAVGSLVLVLAAGTWNLRVSRVPHADPMAPRNLVTRQAAAGVRGHASQGDRFVDCSDLSVQVALLPALWQDPPYVIRNPLPDVCAKWKAQPPATSGSVWMAVRRQEAVAPGWAEAERYGEAGFGVALWRWTGALDQ